MSSALPKEKQSAYQRWELASFGDERPKVAETPQITLAQLNEQIAAAREQGHREGYAAGHAEGLDLGLKEGRATADEEVARFKEVAVSFQNDVTHANELIARDVLDVALDLAKAMLKSALQVRPELVMPIVGEAVRYLPSVQQPAILLLHPEDAKIVRQYMDDELNKAGWRITDDPHIDRGGCRVETASNQIDASMPTRWQRITSALDKQSDWLEP